MTELLSETVQELRDNKHELESNKHQELNNGNKECAALCSNCQQRLNVGECRKLERVHGKVANCLTVKDCEEIGNHDRGGLDKEKQDGTLDDLCHELQNVLLDSNREGSGFRSSGYKTEINKPQRTTVLHKDSESDGSYSCELLPCSKSTSLSRFSFNIEPNKQTQNLTEDSESDGYCDNSLFSMQFGEFVEQRLSCLTYSEDSEYNGECSSIDTDEVPEESKLLERCMTRVKEIPAANGGKQYKSQRLKLVFDKLSTLINSGEFDTFKKQRDCLVKKCPADADLACMLHYLEACTNLFKGNLRECEEIVNRAITRMPFTSNPSRVMVELFSLRCWMFLKENKLNALEYDLQDAAQIIAQDPLACAGKATGWLYVDEARRLIPLMATNNLTRSYAIRDKAIKCLEKALEQFHHETGKDGPFGFYYATILLASLKLACGQLMQTTDLQPTEEELVDATKRLRFVEESSIGHPAILKAQYCMAMSDLHYRRLNLARALNYAEDGYKLAKGLGLPEETKCARARRQFHRNLQEQSLSYRVLGSQSYESLGAAKRRTLKSKYMEVCCTSSVDSDHMQELELRKRPDRTDIHSAVREKDKLHFFVRAWFLIALLSSCWLYSGM